MDRVQALKQALESAQQAAIEARQAAVACETGLNAMVETAEQSRHRAETLRSTFAEHLQAAGFARDIEFQAAKRSPAEIDHLEEAIARYDGDLPAAHDRMARAQQAARERQSVEAR